MLRWPDGRTRPLLFDGQPLLPSAVYLDTTGRLHVGRDALRLGYAEPGRFEPNPKRHIDDQTVLFGGAEVPVADLLAGLLAAVAREAVAAAGFLPPAVLTHPAAWGERRREVLVAAIAKAGWPRETQLLPEPVAAARYFADVLRRPVPVGSALAVFDFGGGTLDVAVVRNEGLAPDGRPRFVVASSGGVDDLGGLDLDSALVDHLGKSLAGAEPQAWQALTEPVTLAQWRARRQLWEDVRGAKEMLSRAAGTGRGPGRRTRRPPHPRRARGGREPADQPRRHRGGRGDQGRRADAARARGPLPGRRLVARPAGRSPAAQ
jgi:molecular chaperone DnaK (HSP70)